MEATTTAPHPMAAYMPEAEAATALGIGVRSLREWRQHRRGPPWLKLGGRIFYRRDALATWLRESEIDPTKAKARRSA